jgi:hypothetical protein
MAAAALSWLRSADGLGPFVYILSNASQGQLGMSANFRLPSGVSCSGGCVLQCGESSGALPVLPIARHFAHSVWANGWHHQRATLAACNSTV